MDVKFTPTTSSHLSNTIQKTEFTRSKFPEHCLLIQRAAANNYYKQCYNIYKSIRAINEKDIQDGKISRFDALHNIPEYQPVTKQKKMEDFKYLQFARLLSGWTYMKSLCFPFDKNGQVRNIPKSERTLQGDLWAYVQNNFRNLRIIEFQNGHFESCEGTWIFFESGGKNNCYSRGMKLMKKGIDLDSDNHNNYKIIGDAFACQATPFYNLNRAEENFKKALSIYPEYSNAIYQLADLYTNKKQWKDATLMFERYLSVTPSRIHTEFPCTYLKSKIEKKV
jgi:tetratricopeptide (TPR) repeat protein